MDLLLQRPAILLSLRHTLRVAERLRYDPAAGHGGDSCHLADAMIPRGSKPADAVPIWTCLEAVDWLKVGRCEALA